MTRPVTWLAVALLAVACSGGGDSSSFDRARVDVLLSDGTAHSQVSWDEAMQLVAEDQGSAPALPWFVPFGLAPIGVISETDEEGGPSSVRVTFGPPDGDTTPGASGPRMTWESVWFEGRDLTPGPAQVKREFDETIQDLSLYELHVAGTFSYSLAGTGYLYHARLENSDMPSDDDVVAMFRSAVE